MATRRSRRSFGVSSSSSTSAPSRAQDIVAVRLAEGGDALAGEKREGDDLRHNQRQDEQRRQAAGQAPGPEPHAGFTSPAKL